MNRIFKVVWSKTKNCYVVVSEIAKRSGKSSSSLNKKVKCSAALALFAMSIALPVHADFPSDKYGESNLSSAAMTTYLNYSHGVDSDNGTYTFGISPQTASQLKTVSVGINGSSGFLPNGKMVLLQNSIVETLNGERNWGYYTYTNKFKYNGKTYTATAKYDPDTDKWTTTILDEEGQPHPDIAIQSAQGDPAVYTNKDIKIEAGKVEKKSNGYFVTNTIKTKDQVSGKEDLSEATVQCGDVVTISKSGTTSGMENFGIKINDESKAKFDAAHYFSYSDNGNRASNYSSVNGPGVKPLSIYSVAAGVDTNVTAVLATATGSHSNIGGAIAAGINSQKPFQGIGATVYGAGNVIGALKTGFGGDGAGNSVIGFANIANTSNGALVWGTGNSVSTSHGEDFPDSVKTAYTTYKSSPTSSNLTKLQN